MQNLETFGRKLENKPPCHTFTHFTGNRDGWSSRGSSPEHRLTQSSSCPRWHPAHCQKAIFADSLVESPWNDVLCTRHLLVSQSPRAHLHVLGMLRFMCDTDQPSLPTSSCSVLVSVSVVMALSTLFHSINSPDNSVFSLCSSNPFSALLVLSTTYLFMKVSFSPQIIPSGWLGSKHQFAK